MSRADPASIFQQALLSYRQGDWPNAEKHCRTALRVVPDHAGLLQMLAVVLMRQAKPAEAVSALDRLLKKQPNLADAWNNRGLALQDLGKPAEAMASYERALLLKPRYAEALNNRAQLLLSYHRVSEAAEAYARLLDVDPTAPYVQGNLLSCRLSSGDWTDFETLHDTVEQRLMRGEPGDNPVSLLWHSQSPMLQLRCAEIYAQREIVAPAGTLPAAPAPTPGRIRLGYLSGDFHDHPMAYMFAPLFENHDRERFETFAFSYGPDAQGPMRTRLRAAFDHFHDLRGKSDFDAAATIRQQGIDILVDLAGYTQGNRAPILAHRPARLQIGFHGFGMGVPFMDYLVSDRQTVPDELQAAFRERIVRLPSCWIATDTPDVDPAVVPTRASQGLPESGFVFCSFNTIYKITPTLFDVWMRLLGSVSGSVLWLRNESAVAIANVRREAEKRGIAGERLIFAGRVPLAEHLARHRLADLFLDTFPYSAQTTASHALWSGLPVLTLRGATAVSRVCSSILQAAGLSDLAVDSLDDYFRLALKLASEPQRHSVLRQRVDAARSSPLFDSVRYRRQVEKAYELMHDRQERGEPPASFDVPDEEPN
ncbi:MAG: tetratricopeptide repeat protein [Acidimicrobiia bacterium]